MSDERKLLKQIKERRDRVYRSQEGGFIGELKNLMDFLNGNTNTCKIIQDLKTKYPNINWWNPTEWEQPHLHMSGWGEGESYYVDVHNPHGLIFEPIESDKRAIGAIILIENIVNGSYSVHNFFNLLDSPYRAYKQITERYVDPLINYLYDTIPVDTIPVDEQKEAPIAKNNTKSYFIIENMVRDNIENHAEVAKEKRDKNRDFTPGQKNIMIVRQGKRCACCSRVIDPVTSQADHKISWERGGRTSMDNGWAICQDCHSLKTTLEKVLKMEKKRKISFR